MWKWVESFKEKVIETVDIKDNDFNPFRVFNFKMCGGKRSWGREIVYKKKNVVVSFSCGESCCPFCSEKSKQKTALKYVDRFMNASMVHGIKRFWTFVITLPEEIEAMIPKGSEFRKEFMKEIKKLIRKIFALKTEDGLCAYANIHPVGDSNLFRDRFHVHVGVLPLAVRRKNKKPELFKCDVDGLIQTTFVLEQLEKILSQLFPITSRGKAQFHAQYIPLDKPYSEAKLAHRLKYDLRGFGKDVIQSPIFYNPDNDFVVLNAGERGYGVYSVEQVARRWAWIRSQRDLRTWGLLNQWNKYVDLLGVEFVEDPEPEILEERMVIVKRRYGREWDHKARRVRWVVEKRAFREDTGEEILGVQWGREGSGGYWRPKGDSVDSGGGD